MPSPRVVAGSLLLLAPLPALAQLAPGDKAPTEPTANDPSIGTPSPPAASLKNPVGLAPQAGRAEGTSSGASKNGPAEEAKDKR